MSALSFNWSVIVPYLAIYSSDGNGEMKYVSTQNSTWDTDLFSTCTKIDFLNHFMFTNITVKEIIFVVSKRENMGITIYIEERNKMLSKRLLKNNILSYF